MINAVVPQVNADMLTYSSDDAMVYGSDAQSVRQSLTQAFKTIEKLAPDPQGLGNRRILISEYGLFENEQPGDTWRAEAVLGTAKNAGLYGAFFWNLYDNECKLNGQYAPVASAQGNPLRPTDAQCRGRWIIRPDGSTFGARCDQEILVAPPGGMTVPRSKLCWGGGFPRGRVRTTGTRTACHEADDPP